MTFAVISDHPPFYMLEFSQPTRKISFFFFFGGGGGAN